MDYFENKILDSFILFVSKKNSVRSQIAEAFAKRMAEHGVKTFSAGIESNEAIPSVVKELMGEQGLDFSDQYPKQLSALGNKRFDIVITIGQTARKKCGVLAGAPTFVHWSLKDCTQTAGSPAEIRNRAEQLIKEIDHLVSALFSGGFLEAIVVNKKNVDRIFNSLSEGIIAHDSNKKVFLFSQKAVELSGISEKEAISRECNDIFDLPLCGHECSFCEDGNIDNFDIKTYNTVFHTSTGIRKECKVTTVPIKDEYGKTQGVMASLSDITDQRSLERLLGKEASFEGIIGNHAKMLMIFQQIRDVSSYDYPVCIYGETGTGKELVAKAIHNESGRKNGPFIPINCGALPEGLIESELFGHVKGAFTGAIRDKIGRFEMAQNGTIFLDEIADLPKPAQVKLLRVLQEGVFEKVGSEESIKVNARIIAATNFDLKEQIKQDRFREDLYYRLNVIPIDIPPLRERKNDIPLLCKHFLNRINESNSQKLSMSSEVISIIMDYDWPGNVRELENVIRFSVVKCQGTVISHTDLPKEIKSIVQPVFVAKPESIKPKSESGKLDKQMVISTLLQSRGNKVKAAKLLGVGRATLYRFFEKHPDIFEPSN